MILVFLLAGISWLPQISAVEDFEICAKWKLKGHSGFCNDALFPKTCPDSYQEECEGRNFEEKSAPKPKPNPRPKIKKGYVKEEVSAKQVKETKQREQPKPKKTEPKPTTTTTTTTTTTKPKKLDFVANAQECCRANGVKEACIGLCGYGDSTGLCKPENDCEDEFETVNYCNFNGADRTKCCIGAGVRPKECAAALCNANSYPTAPGIVPWKACLDQHVAKMKKCERYAFSGTKDWKVRNDWRKNDVWPIGVKNFVAANYCPKKR